MSPNKKPKIKRPPKTWKYYSLWEKVQSTLRILPEEFTSAISISGIRATEVFTFGAVLSATIEEEVVRVLNDLREYWDPDDKYPDFEFIRQAEAFPDILLIDSKTDDIIFGIELKSWYILAKEGEPSFRFATTADACAKPDLFIVIPWALSNVVSGYPIIYEPFIELSKYVADYRTHWWQEIRDTNDSTEIFMPKRVKPYPEPRDKYSDKPEKDDGKNFGRVARMGLMDDFIKKIKKTEILGIEVTRWINFFKS